MQLKRFFIKCLLKAIGSLPLSVLYTVADRAASKLCATDCRLRRVVRANLKACMPEVSSQIEKQAIRESAYGFVEMLYFWQCSEKKLKSHVSAVKGRDAFEKARKAGQGVLLLGPHLGSWEISNLYFSPMVAMYDPPKKASLRNYMKKARERFGSTLVPANVGGVKALFRSLRQGRVVGVLPDQDPDHQAGSHFIPFFGNDALTMSLPVRLAQKHQVPTFFVFSQRKSKGEFVIHFLPVDQAFYSKDEIKALTAMNKGIEDCVKMCPAQYQWAYKRFKRRPEGSGSLYD